MTSSPPPVGSQEQTQPVPSQGQTPPVIEQVFDPSIGQMTYCFSCPHCDGKIQVPPAWINCTIFRHAILADGTMLNPHASKEMCEQALAAGQIRGCSKPFKFNGLSVEKCDYI